MFKNSFVKKVGFPVTFAVFILTFFMFFRETRELFSSLTASILGAILIFGAFIVADWIIQIFKKS